MSINLINHMCKNSRSVKCLCLCLPSGDVFSFSDITRNVLVYRHGGRSNQDDHITVSVSDGISMATTVVTVAVLGAGGNGPQPDPAAALSLEVKEKSSTVIRRAHLAYSVSDWLEHKVKLVWMISVLCRLT